MENNNLRSPLASTYIVHEIGNPFFIICHRLLLKAKQRTMLTEKIIAVFEKSLVNTCNYIFSIHFSWPDTAHSTSINIILIQEFSSNLRRCHEPDTDRSIIGYYPAPLVILPKELRRNFSKARISLESNYRSLWTHRSLNTDTFVTAHRVGYGLPTVTLWEIQLSYRHAYRTYNRIIQSTHREENHITIIF